MKERKAENIELNTDSVTEVEFVTLPSGLNPDNATETEKKAYPDFFEDVVFTHYYVW